MLASKVENFHLIYYEFLDFNLLGYFQSFFILKFVLKSLIIHFYFKKCYNFYFLYIYYLDNIIYFYNVLFIF